MLTPRENFLRFFKGEPCEWTPSILDQQSFRPVFIPDHVARGLVAQQTPYTGDFGGLDLFGVDWYYDPKAGGSMEKGVLFDDVAEWREKVVFPDLEKLDWEGCARENRDFLTTDKLVSTTIYTGFFERLISFVGFENAAMALIDDEQQDDVKALFTALADFYVDLIRHMHRYFGVEMVELHDDWGTQISPMFSVATHAEMIAPFVRRVAEGAHADGVFYEQHSCGKIEDLMPNLIATGADTWRGQAVNDKHRLVETYGDRFRFCVEIRPAAPVTNETALALVRDAYRQWKGKNVWLAIGRPFTPEQKAMMCALVRELGVL